MEKLQLFEKTNTDYYYYFFFFILEANQEESAAKSVQTGSEESGQISRQTAEEAGKDGAQREEKSA